jgi:FtsP/CotA-like multicopper oxidase with cupredoxin domain
MTGNCWKKINLAYTVTANTFLEFDFQSSAQAEIQGIGFDTNDAINDPQSLLFQVYGTQSYGTIYNTYGGSGVQHYVIPVGTYYTGSFNYLTFANDDDAAPIGESVFSNIQIYEGTPPPTPMLIVNGTGYPVESYGGAQDVSSTVSIENSGQTLRIVGNGWKKVAIPYNVTASTVLDFDFSSGVEPEISGIGFDVDDTINNPIRIFQLFGTQTYGIQSFNNYVAGSGTVHYTIPVGTFYTGSFLSLTFTNDHDVPNPNGESVFSNIIISDPSAQAPQTITFGPLVDKTFGDPDFNVSASASSGLPVSFAAAGDCTVAGTLVSLTGVGSCTITASQAGNASWLPAPNVPQTFNINPASSGTTVDLCATAGSVTMPDGNVITVWGYALGDCSGSPVASVPGPQLTFTQGDAVIINLHNNLGEQTALLFQGQSMIPDLTGAAPAGVRTYTFTASKPGTFLYEAGLLPNAQHQVAMGMYGALIVRPAGAPSQAYASAATSFDAEQVLVLSELDPTLNNSSNPETFDIRNYSPKYYLINGKAYPNTAAVSVAAGDKLLLRYVNAGLQAHSMSTLGLTQQIIGQDGNAVTFGHLVVAETIATGQTLDTVVTVPAGAANGTQYPVYDASLFLRNNAGTGSSAGLGGMLTTLTVGTVAPPADTSGPVTSALGVTPNPSDGTVGVTLTGTISDLGTGNSNIAAAEYFIDASGANGTGTAMSGTFASPTETVSTTISTATLATLSPGAHTIYVHGQDSAGNWGAFASVSLNLETSVIPPATQSLYFSTVGVTSSGPNGVGANAADIYFYDGTAFSQAIAAVAGGNVDAFDWVDATHYYMSFSGDVTLPVIGTVQNEDVVYYNAGTWSVYFDGTAHGLGASNIDAISVAGGALYFSTSDTTLPPGVGGVGDDADIYYWDGSAFQRVFDATALGWSSNNVDGFAYLDSSHFYLSYSPTSTVVPGLGTVQDEDVVYYNNGVWSVYFDGTSKGLTSTATDVDAFDIP